MSSGPNLFARLHKWAAIKGQEENFFTESLALVLEHLLIRAPKVGVRLVSQLTGGFIEDNRDRASTIEIQTQVVIEEGRPDLEISTPEQLVWCEVKVGSGLRKGQLDKYRKGLRKTGIDQTRLVLLTRYLPVFQTDETLPDLEVRWFEFADWLEKELSAVEAPGEIAGFLAQQFLDFLRERRMVPTPVSWHLSEGVRALSNLLNMLREAAAACQVRCEKAAVWNYSGITLDGAYKIGVFHHEPGKLCFNTLYRIDLEEANRLGVGTVDGWQRWCRDADLYSESIYFFSRSKVSQLQWLVGFPRECLKMAPKSVTPDQPPIPEEPEGD